MFGTKIIWLNTLVLVAAISMFSTPIFGEEPKLEGTWSFTFYSEPHHAATATQCVVFKTIRTEPSGEERSGTWTSPSFPFQGEWQQDGDHIQWYGFTTGGGLALSFFGHMPSDTTISGEFNTFFSPDGATSNAGGWVGTRADCASGKKSSAESLKSIPTDRDPTRK
jgi:hypothetical protein